MQFTSIEEAIESSLQGKVLDLQRSLNKHLTVHGGLFGIESDVTFRVVYLSNNTLVIDMKALLRSMLDDFSEVHGYMETMEWEVSNTIRADIKQSERKLPNFFHVPHYFS